MSVIACRHCWKCHTFLMHFIWVSLHRGLIGDTIFTSPTRDGTAILCGLPHEGLAVCRAKAVPLFLSYFKTLSIGPVRESNLQPPTLQSSALPTELHVIQLWVGLHVQYEKAGCVLPVRKCWPFCSGVIFRWGRFTWGAGGHLIKNFHLTPVFQFLTPDRKFEP